MHRGIRMEQGTNNVIGALCGTVPFAFTAFDCSIDSDVFHTWATEILLPELPACSVIVMDNASFHKRQDTLDALQAEGHTVLWRCCGFHPIARISTR
ncbi:transposase [uncultured Cardiobacterium sp.]|uniref:transposase n=1 Tax=uncultured Cardiobacterium sp. TaxID=417619 RepID=UPI00344608B5